VCSNNSDPFALMRLALQVERGISNAQAGLPIRLELAAARLLPLLTTEAAAAIGAGSFVGSLRHGMQADVVVLSSNTTNMFAWTPGQGALVTQAHAGNVEAVLVRGRFVKRAHALVDVDLLAVRRALETVRASLLERTGGEAQLLSARATLLQHWNLGQAEVGAGVSAQST
jgi:cytosine/adenosine deaminase-related metal-dependent hydrolase